VLVSIAVYRWCVKPLPLAGDGDSVEPFLVAARKCWFRISGNEITIVFCGSKKGLANGIPMANILFPRPQCDWGMPLVAALMIFHIRTLQLMVCAVAGGRRYKRPRTGKKRAPGRDPRPREYRLKESSAG